jgi:hypothetical protein
MGNKLTFLWDGDAGGKPVKFRYTEAHVSPLLYTYKAEVSVSKDPWTVIGEGKDHEGQMSRTMTQRMIVEKSRLHSLDRGSTTMQRESQYAGMTTNERLFEAGLLSEWNAAARSRNRERMIELLGKVDLGDQAEWIADTVLANPGKYGF